MKNLFMQKSMIEIILGGIIVAVQYMILMTHMINGESMIMLPRTTLIYIIEGKM